MTIGGQTHFRDYAALTGGPFVGESDLLSDSVLRNRNGVMTLTLSDLIDGNYSMTTYHHGTHFGAGTISEVLLTDGVVAGALVHSNVTTSAGTTPDVDAGSSNLLARPRRLGPNVRVQRGLSSNHLSLP